MPLENIPWAVGGGIVSPAQARMVAYQATNGEEGIATLGDLLVRPLAVAGGSVRISPGGFVALNRYPGAKGESYIGRAGDETIVPIAPNAGTTTRYDLVIVRIDDWNMPGGQATPATLPTNSVPAEKFQVISNVASNVKTAAQLNLNYPAVALARIAIPAATSAITQAMITDLREVAVPRRKRDLRAVAQVAGRDNTLGYTGATGEMFPNDAQWTVEIPAWASRVRLKADWIGMQLRSGKNYSLLWVQIGSGRSDMISSQASAVDNVYTPASQGDYSRINGATADDLAIPAAMRGQSVVMKLIGRKMAGSTVDLRADGLTAMVLDLEFIESATEDV